MRLMATSAIALGRGMHLPFGHFFLEALVTSQAEIRTLHLEKLLQLRPMGIMTGGALVRNDRRMLALVFLNVLHEFVMAGQAEFPLLLCGHPDKITTMRIVTGKAIAVSEGNMVIFAGRRFEKAAMALRTELYTSLLEQFFLFAAMRRMAGLTTAVTHRAMGMGLDKLIPFFRMTGIANNIHSLLEHLRKIGAMGIVACRTILVHKGRMSKFCLIRLLGFRMTVKAKFTVPGKEQTLVFRRMGGMAGKTSLFPHHGRMGKAHHHILVAMTGHTKLASPLQEQFGIVRNMRVMTGKTFPCLEGCMLNGPVILQALRIMALAAHFAVLHLCFEGLCRPSRIMTTITLLGCDRIVNTGLEKLCLGRGVWVMADHAGLALLHRIAAMRLFEPTPPRLMTTQTERDLLFDQEVRFVCTMGRMAGLATNAF